MWWAAAVTLGRAGGSVFIPAGGRRVWSLFAWKIKIPHDDKISSLQVIVSLHSVIMMKSAPLLTHPLTERGQASRAILQAVVAQKGSKSKPDESFVNLAVNFWSNGICKFTDFNLGVVKLLGARSLAHTPLILCVPPDLVACVHLLREPA